MAQSEKQQYLFLTVLLSAFVVSFIPYVSWPFACMETYLHEITHALVAVATWGEVDHCELRWDGSGRCLVAGGWPSWIAFSGYAGAVVWGALIYFMTDTRHALTSTIISAFFALLILVTLLLWIKDPVTALILLVLAGFFIAAVFFSRWISVKWLLRFMGLSVLLGATEAPIALLDGLAVGDAALLAQMTPLPEPVWVVVWEGMAVLALFAIWRHSFGGHGTGGKKN